MTCFSQCSCLVCGLNGCIPLHDSPSKFRACVAPLMLLLAPQEHSTRISDSVDVFPVEYILIFPLQSVSPR